MAVSPLFINMADSSFPLITCMCIYMGLKSLTFDCSYVHVAVGVGVGCWLLYRYVSLFCLVHCSFVYMYIYLCISCSVHCRLYSVPSLIEIHIHRLCALVAYDELVGVMFNQWHPNDEFICHRHYPGRTMMSTFAPFLPGLVYVQSL